MQRSKTVFIKNVPKVKEVKLTPKEKMLLKKKQEAEAKAELMRQGAIDAQKNYNFAKQKNQEQLHAGSKNMQKHNSVINNESKPIDLRNDSSIVNQYNH